MAPKSKRGRERDAFDRSKFASGAAQVRYNEFASNRKFIVERNFYRPGGQIEDTIVALNWQRFCFFSAVAVIPVVREFYANIIDAEDDEVFVRGTGVSFTPARINIFYGLPPSVECYYSGLSPSEEDLDFIIGFLTDGTGTWKIRNEKRVNFSSSKLNGVSKAWHYFISARLIPSNHISEVTRDRAILNYCIQHGKSIDVGNIIYDSIDTTARSSTSVGLGFPSLIYSLCEESGVTVERSEEKLKATKPIGRESVSIYDRLRGKRSSIPSSSVPEPSRPSTSRPSTSAEPPLDFWKDMNERMAEIYNFSILTGSRVDTLDRKFDHFSDYTRRKSDYDIQHDEALVRFLKGEQDVQFPVCPRYDPYDPRIDPDLVPDDEETDSD